MSQSKTIIQGLEPADSPSRNMGGTPNFYQRNGRPVPPSRGTVVPGMMETTQRAVYNVQPETLNPHQPQQRSIVSGKPVVGFLYSVSRTMAGEYWPLYVGQNTIGQSPSCSVVLPEGTVSGEHAVLVVRRMKNPEKVIASISDARSTNGTMVNGESLGFSAVECKNGDIITIGDNYELFLILIDPTTLGLKPSENFVPVVVEDAEEEFDPFSNGQFDPMSPMPPTPTGFTPAQPAYNSFQPAATVGLDGSSSSNKGGTVGM